MTNLTYVHSPYVAGLFACSAVMPDYTISVFREDLQAAQQWRAKHAARCVTAIRHSPTAVDVYNAAQAQPTPHRCFDVYAMPAEALPAPDVKVEINASLFLTAVFSQASPSLIKDYVQCKGTAELAKEMEPHQLERFAIISDTIRDGDRSSFRQFYLPLDEIDVVDAALDVKLAAEAGPDVGNRHFRAVVSHLGIRHMAGVIDDTRRMLELGKNEDNERFAALAAAGLNEAQTRTMLEDLMVAVGSNGFVWPDWAGGSASKLLLRDKGSVELAEGILSVWHMHIQ